MKTVLITGADRGCGFSLCREYLTHGWWVYAGQFMPEWPELNILQTEFPDTLTILPLDVSQDSSVQAAYQAIAEENITLDHLVNVAGIGGRDESRESMAATFNVNTLGPLRMVEAFLPLMANGDRRLGFFSSEAGVNTLAHRDGGFSYVLSKTAYNMEVKLLFNQLYPKGYTFRLYHPGWVRSYMGGRKSAMGNFEPEESAAVCFRQMTTDRPVEDVLVMWDVNDEIWTF